MGGKAANHLVLVLFELTLAFKKGALLVLRQDHVLFGLLLLHFGDAHHLVVLVNHLVDDSVNLLPLLLVLHLGLLGEVFAVLHLLLHNILVLAHLSVLINGLLIRLSISDFLSTQHFDLDVGVTLL